MQKKIIREIHLLQQNRNSVVEAKWLGGRICSKNQ